MNIRAEILKGYSRAQVNKIVDYVGNDPARFKVLVEVYLKGPYRITQRAAQPLTYCAERNPALVRPHLKTLLDHLMKPGVHDAAKRNTIRLLQFIEIPKPLQGKVAGLCFGYLQNRKEAVAIRVFSMTVLAAIAANNPALKPELKMLIEDQLHYGSCAFISRARKVLKSLANH